MGAIHPRYTTWTLDMLAGCRHIALVRPDDPELRVEEHTMGGGPANAPRMPKATYRLGFHRYVVEQWLTAKGPERIEVPSASNERAVQDAGDRVSGKFGHVHRIVQMHQLEASLQAATTPRRIVFLASGNGERFSELAPGLALAPELLERVRERIGKVPAYPAAPSAAPVPPPKRR